MLKIFLFSALIFIVGLAGLRASGWLDQQLAGGPSVAGTRQSDSVEDAAYRHHPEKPLSELPVVYSGNGGRRL